VDACSVFTDREVSAATGVVVISHDYNIAGATDQCVWYAAGERALTLAIDNMDGLPVNESIYTSDPSYWHPFEGTCQHGAGFEAVQPGGADEVQLRCSVGGWEVDVDVHGPNLPTALTLLRKAIRSTQG
jgi:hypothetical protein